MQTYLYIFLSRNVQCIYQYTKVTLKQKKKEEKKEPKGQSAKTQYGTEEKTRAWWGGSVGRSVVPYTKMFRVRFPTRAHN